MQQAQMLQMQTMQRAPHPGLARVDPGGQQAGRQPGPGQNQVRGPPGGLQPHQAAPGPGQHAEAPKRIGARGLKHVTQPDDTNTTPHDAARWHPHTAASMDGVLSCEQAYELLTEPSFRPGHRTAIIRKDEQGIRPPLFKECPKRRLKGEPGADRWRNSGGEKGSSFLRNKQCAPLPPASAFSAPLLRRQLMAWLACTAVSR